MLDLISILVAGFSIFSAAILFVTYAFLLQFPHKTWHSLLSGGLLVLSLSIIQLGHVTYFVNGDAPLDDPCRWCRCLYAQTSSPERIESR